MAQETFFIIKIRPGCSTAYLTFAQTELMIGRSVDCDIQLAGNPVLCHGKQCRIRSADGGIWVFGSSNFHGNYLNGVRIEGPPVLMTPADELTISVNTATFRVCATTEESEELQEGRRLAASPQTPHETLRALSQQHDLKTILTLLENPNTPTSLLAKLAVFSPRRFWQNPATALLSMEDPALELFSEHSLLALLESPYTPESLRDRLALHPSTNFQKYGRDHSRETPTAAKTEGFDKA